MTENLQGEVLTIVYHDPNSQYVVARIKAPQEPGQVTIVGNMGQLVPGEKVNLTGKWNEHPRFGRQFKVDSFSQSLPASIHGIQRYLASGMIKGLGPALAERLVHKFGRSVLDIMDSNPERLLEVEGIGPKKKDKILQSWQEQKEVRSLLLFLQTHEVPPTFAGKIFQRYGSGAIEKLQQNPYDLAYDIRGIGFKTADQMALKLGFSTKSPQRLEAALVFTLFQFSEQGNLFCPREELLEKVAKFVQGIDFEDLQKALESLQEKKRIFIQDLPQQDIKQAVFLRHFYRWEMEIASRLKSLLDHPAGSNNKSIAYISSLENMMRIALSGEQTKTVEHACSSKVFIITGGPGTGKTTITKLIVKIMEKMGLKVKLAAPTGRASKRLSEATGCSAYTIHRLLGFQPDGQFTHDEEKKLKLDALILDEVSMLDCQLFVHLLRALPLTSRIILIGDVNQLPSVGPGNILYDLLQSEAIPYMALNKIYRQARESMLVMNAHRINQGYFPLMPKKEPPEADFFWVEQEDVEKVRDLILYMVCERIPKVYDLDPMKDIQVLSPMHKGTVGNNDLNKLLQNRLNPSGTELRSGGRIFRCGDRVLQMRNNYEKGVFNGDLGWIYQLDLEEGELLVDFDGEKICYDQTETDELSLAYSISVHKSQGSEYPSVLIPVVTQHYMLLQRNLLYTALTRARQLAIMIGSKRALGIGIKNAGKGGRYTHLRYRIREIFAQDRK